MKLTAETTNGNSKLLLSYIERKINLSISIDNILNDIKKLLERHKYNDLLKVGRGGSHIWIAEKQTNKRIAIITN